MPGDRALFEESLLLVHQEGTRTMMRLRRLQRRRGAVQQERELSPLDPATLLWHNSLF